MANSRFSAGAPQETTNSTYYRDNGGYLIVRDKDGNLLYGPGDTGKYGSNSEASGSSQDSGGFKPSVEPSYAGDLSGTYSGIEKAFQGQAAAGEEVVQNARTEQEYLQLRYEQLLFSNQQAEQQLRVGMEQIGMLQGEAQRQMQQQALMAQQEAMQMSMRQQSEMAAAQARAQQAQLAMLQQQAAAQAEMAAKTAEMQRQQLALASAYTPPPKDTVSLAPVGDLRNSVDREGSKLSNLTSVTMGGNTGGFAGDPSTLLMTA